MKTQLLLMGIGLSLCLMACLGREKYDPEKYENLHRFQEHVTKRYDSLRQVYGFPRFNFDAEYIYSPEDPAELLRSLLDSLTNFETQIISSQLTDDGRWYEVQFKVNQRDYRYRTEANSDWVNIEGLEKVLGYIAEDLAPADTFVFPFWPGDQSADVLFGKKEDFADAFWAGFPMNGPGVHWRLGQRLVEGANYYHLAVERSPSEQEVEEFLLQAIAELDRKGFAIPALNRDRIYISDIFKEQQLILCINGEIGNSHIKLARGSLHFTYYGYAPLVLWQMLQTRPEAKVRALRKEGDIILSKQEFEERLFELLPRK
ncbi:MAG: hypothetical protein AAFN10_11735 [Bacteroidota bacterium]